MLPRKNRLIRPAVSNVYQAVVVFAITDPMPNLNLLDRFLVMMERQEVPVSICFNKIDLVDAAEQEKLRAIYEPAGYPVHFISTYEPPSQAFSAPLAEPVSYSLELYRRP